MLGSQRRTGRSSGNRRPPPSRHDEQDSVDLPPYEPPKCPLTDDIKRQLKELSTSRINDTYEKHTAESTKLLSTTVYAINERVTHRKRTAAQNAERAAKRKHSNDDAEGDDEGAAAERAEGAVQELEGEVSELATLIEEAMRGALDMQAALEDEKSVLRDLPDMVADRQRIALELAQQDREADEGDPEPPEVSGVPIFNVFDEARDAKAAEYDKLPPYEKYARNNSYIDFKQSWHEGLYENPDDIPLPDATKWFDRDGRPRLETRKDERQGGADADEEDGDEDDEIQIAREKRSFRCPLTLSVMREPYTCRLCKHSFEKDSIMEYLGGGNGRGRVAKCPEAGCHVEAMTAQDLYFDEALLRRIKRAEQAEREAAERSSDQEDEDEEEGSMDASHVSRASARRRVKAEPGGDDEDQADDDGSV
ncbi:hypothetical protein N8I77_011104 [Diaporthe amygdali]|uniref:SP-RING-type domain-containing protein n=1 Tax=Phomopsis amygdali TaxID=1214568 RepID=A0AAD9S4Q8_PHOAM|nr:hypothetical protein N8I77_011104 [Diaporthe amygdali]